MRYVRELGFTEKLASLINEKIPHNIISVAKLNCAAKNVDLNKLSCAWKIFQNDQPLASATVHDGCFYSQSEPGISIETVVSKDGRWESLAEDFLVKQLGGGNCLFRLVIVDVSSKSSYIMLIGQHTVCDGVSIVSALCRLLNIYDCLLDGREICVKPVRLPFPALENLLPKVSGADFEINESLPDTFSYEPVSADKRKTGLCSESLSPEETRHLVIYAKKSKLKVNSILLASTLITLYENSSISFEELGCNTMVNMRRFLTTTIPDDYLGFYSGYIHKEFSPLDCSLDELAKKINFSIQDAIKTNGHIVATKCYTKLITEGLRASKLLDIIKVERPTAGISNIGAIEVDHGYNNFSINELQHCVTSHAYSRTDNTFFLCASTYNDILSFVVHHPLPLFSRPRASLFAKEIKEKVISLL